VTRSIADFLADARALLNRVSPAGARAAADLGALLVDIRPSELRIRDGAIPGALAIDRNVLEWRLDPASPDRMPEMTSYDAVIVLVCDEGYASSLAAATMHQLGLRNATDLVGGFQAWRSAGLPVVPAAVV
jgi:rhodanese-related sulfurtransferase